MGSVEGIGDLDAEIQDKVDGHGLAVDPMLECLAFEEFHGQEGTAVFLADVVDGADIWVVKRRGGARFAAETVEHGKLAADLVRQKLERDETAKTAVFSLIDDAHSPTAKFFDHSIMGDGFADHT
jgi:hypothetical protein